MVKYRYLRKLLHNLLSVNRLILIFWTFICCLLYFHYSIGLPQSTKIRSSSGRTIKLDLESQPFASDFFEPSDDPTSAYCSFLVNNVRKSCLRAGTNCEESKKRKECVCKFEWFGSHCGFPKDLNTSDSDHQFESLKLIMKPRKIIQAFPFNHEFECLELRLHELYDHVDHFIILESNYTAYGSRKSFNLKNRMDRTPSYLRQYRDKIHLAFLTEFPSKGLVDGWAADDELRNYIGRNVLFKVITDYEPSDLFFLHDADEIPPKNLLLFLKYHSGYGFPIGIFFRWNVFGFFWCQPSKNIDSVVSMEMMELFFINQTIRIRNINAVADKLSTMRFNHSIYHHWHYGSETKPVGWHCSWCFSPTDIKTKLVSAQRSDGIRFGSMPEKLNLTYIKNLIKVGMWFDDESKLDECNRNQVYYAPDSAFQNYARFKHLIDNPYL